MSKFVVFLILLGLCLSAVKCGSEREGAVKSDDCREQIPIQEGSFAAFNKTFDCQYEKSKSGKIMSGSCTAVETDGSTCKSSYTYQKAPWKTCSPGFRLKDDDLCYGCPAHSSLGIDDLCHLDANFRWSVDHKSAIPMPGFHWNPDRTTAVPDELPPGATLVDGGRQ
jgi:hypothetical protein